jgi:hypothetical protein
MECTLEIAKLVLEYLKVAFSAPVVAGGVAAALLFTFRSELRGLLNRIAKIKLPGGTELSTSQLERSSEELPAKGQQPEPLAAPSSAATPIANSQTFTPEQLTRLEAVLSAERARAALWEYRYLNFFLARSTQLVFDWLATLPSRTTLATLDAVWLPVFPSAQERQAIVSALQAHYLIALTGDLVEVTPKGREYLQWRGPLPNAAA